ncbi:DNA-packaging protein [[Clostridium] symbiosum]|uniref:DNA-packaging protein n=1 Tax=Clostridium symbiosum TaxID=1512 RepID=UPI0034A34854
MIVNQKELAQCLGISSRRVRMLRDEGLFKITQEGRGYNLEKSVQEYIEYKVNAETGRRASISKDEVQAEHEEVKKQISLLKLRKLRRELHEAADVEAFLSDMLIRFKNRLLSLPSKLAMQVMGEEDINAVILIIKRELNSVLEELSAYDPEEIDGQQDDATDEVLDEYEEDEEMDG